jgi:ABC-type transport system involved in cytochrome c biogenesis permease subunit
VRETVLFATVLFLVAIAQRFKFRGVRIAATAVAAALMVVALVGVISLPRL